MKILCFGSSYKVYCLSLILVCNVFISGCALAFQQDKSELMFIKASALTKLSTSVESYVLYNKPDGELSDQDLLKLATEDDPSLLDPFNGYMLKVNRDFGHAIVMLCNIDGTKGLLEDAGCTAKMDEYLWENDNSCEFTISSEIVCAQ